MKTLLGFLIVCGVLLNASAQTWAPKPVPDGAVLPTNRTTDSLGNSYSVNLNLGFDTARPEVIKTAPDGTRSVFAVARASQIIYTSPTSTDIAHTFYAYKFTAVTVDGSDNVYAAAVGLGSMSIATVAHEYVIKITPGGTETEVAEFGGFVPDTALINNCEITADAEGNVYTTGVGGDLFAYLADGSQLTVAPGSLFFSLEPRPSAPRGLAADAQGNLFMTASYLDLVGVFSIYSGRIEFVRLTDKPIVTFQPSSATILYGATQQFSVVAANTGLLAYQWFLDGAAIPGAAGAMTAARGNSWTSTFNAAQPGTYSVLVTDGRTDVMSSPAALKTVTSAGVGVVPSPTITTQPQSTVVAYGGSATLSAAAVASLPLSYQWQWNGKDIAGATSTTFQASAPGSYSISVTTTAGTETSDIATVSLASRPVNISSRALVGTDADIGIAGFAILSYTGATKRVLIRAVGPGLAGFQLDGRLAAPVLTVFDATQTQIARNDGWNDAPEISAAGDAVGAFPLSPGSSDAALLLDLVPGNYTAQVSGGNGTSGVALIEVYELDPDSGHFVNVSTRAFVGTGANIMIGGFVVDGSQPARMLLRAIGPGLVPLGVSGVLPAPVLAVYDSKQRLIAVNIGWSSGSSADAVSAASAAARTGAFALQPGSADSAIVLDLAPGAYTVQVSGANNTTGVALVEAYQIPQ